jgi:hypothetical protein
MLLVSNPTPHAGVVTSFVETTQVALTILGILGLDPTSLDPVRKKGTPVRLRSACAHRRLICGAIAPFRHVRSVTCALARLRALIPRNRLRSATERQVYGDRCVHHSSAIF